MSEAARSAHLVDPAELRTRLARDPGTVVLDVRHAMPADRADREAYLAGHLPGAVLVDVDADLAGVSTGRNGRRPLPDPAVFEKTVRRWGIATDTPVVVYGAARSAARLGRGGCCGGPVWDRCACSTVGSRAGAATWRRANPRLRAPRATSPSAREACP